MNGLDSIPVGLKGVESEDGCELVLVSSATKRLEGVCH